MYWFYSCFASCAESIRGRFPFRLIVRVASDKWPAHEKESRFLGFQIIRKVVRKCPSFSLSTLLPSNFQLFKGPFFYFWVPNPFGSRKRELKDKSGQNIIDPVESIPCWFSFSSFSWMETTPMFGYTIPHLGKQRKKCKKRITHQERQSW